jgi:GNAT superfamily N-acetyltransferase
VTATDRTSLERPTGPASAAGPVRARAGAWRRAALEAVCDVLEPWEHGIVARAGRYPNVQQYNVVQVDRRPSMSIDQLIEFTEEALGGLAHRRIDFQLAEAGDPLQAGFQGRGWEADRLLWMRYDAGRPPPAPEVAVEEVPYDAVRDLRLAWHREEPDRDDVYDLLSQAREVSLARNAHVFTAGVAGRPVAFAQLERHGAAAEIVEIFVDRPHRGQGLGTAVIRAAIAAAEDVEDLWLCADDEDWPKRFYGRIGFRPVSTTLEFLRYA